MMYNAITNKRIYQEEQNELLYNLLQKRFFQFWEKPELFQDNTSLSNNSNIELFITPYCNQSCSYCYLVKYPELYPQGISNDKILENLKIFLNWINEKNFYLPDIDLFSGEIWHTKLGFDILDIILDYCKNNKLKIKQLMIPTNGTFLKSDETFYKMQNFIDDFKEIGVRLCISLSIDGAIIENKTRPLNNKELKTDSFYERAFAFAKYNNFAFHPMISAVSVKDWMENYKWWKSEYKKYDLNIYDLMMLEVRNSDWTEESIQEYNNFLNFLLQDFLSDCKSVDEAVQCLFNLSPSIKKSINLNNNNYLPYAITKNNTYPACTIATHLCVRLGDLAISPCHRTGYEKNIYGYFQVENNKIVGVKANNPYMAMRILFGNNTICSPKCDTCDFNKVCLQGCFGAQMEYNQDPFMPIPKVCTFFKSKYINLVRQYKKLGILNALEKYHSLECIQYPMAHFVLNFCNGVLDKYGMES